ncbi:MAG TPA: hypothetical protein VFV17_06215 [Usitatibacteraceae bacterium]|nr:hypothetical protein [Usitatibacteraceae bacterium]
MSEREGGSSAYASLLSLHELASRLGSQVDSAHREIGETRAILKDAIGRLMPAFTAMRASDAAPVMNPSRREAFSALQFQDISDQLLAHAQGRLAALQATVRALEQAIDAGGRDPQRIQLLLQTVEQANDSLAGLDLSLVKPVGKAHLGTGDMELF